MTREEHLRFCKKCTNRKMDFDQGIICSLTGKIADFEDSCEDYNRDETVKDEIQVEDRSSHEIISELPSDIQEKFRPHQDLTYALIGGLALSIISALIWAIVTVSTEYQIGYMAVGVGILVGFGVRFFGAGIEPVYGFIGAFYSFLGCILGNLFSQIGFIAHAESLGYFQTITLMNFETIVLIYKESFNVIDLLFYGVAVVEGYKFAFRTIPGDVLNTDDFTPQYSKLRLPLVISCFLILSFTGYSLSKGVSGEQVFYYENGQKQVIANYESGLENGKWIWFYENGHLMQEGTYKNGLFDGTWLNYNELGILIDSTNYVNGRMQGEHKSFYPNGNLQQIGIFNRDRQEGLWKVYNENGTPSVIGSFKDGKPFGRWKIMDLNGQLAQELEYFEDDVVNILNVWDPSGVQVVTDGNGTFKTYYDQKILSQEGKVQDGEKTGIWTSYFSNGKIQEKGRFEKNQYILQSAWSETGEPMIENGNGQYISFFENSTNVYQEGSFKDGLKNGNWLVYHPNSILIQQDLNYEMGLLNGRCTNYFANGNIASEGNFIDDKKTGEWKWYYESGVLQCTITYANDLKQGDQIFYSESGKEVKKEIYVDGELMEEKLL